MESEVSGMQPDQNYSVSDFLLIRFSTNKKQVFYVGKVLSILDKGLEVEFLRQKRQTF